MAMKKRLVLFAAAAFVIILCGSVYAAGRVAHSLSIDEETAQNFAFVDADILPEDAVVSDTDFDFENGRFVYEIEFSAQGVRYHYVIDAKNGSVISREQEGTRITAAASESANAASSENRQRSEQARLRRAVDVGVCHTDLVALAGQGYGEIHRYHRFAHAALAAGNGNNAAHLREVLQVGIHRHLLWLFAGAHQLQYGNVVAGESRLQSLFAGIFNAARERVPAGENQGEFYGRSIGVDIFHHPQGDDVTTFGGVDHAA